MCDKKQIERRMKIANLAYAWRKLGDALTLSASTGNAEDLPEAGQAMRLAQEIEKLHREE